jgi:hypothetical protein
MIEGNKRAAAPITSETILYVLALSSTAALQYQVANCDNNNKNGYDGHPVKTHCRECSSDGI